jgi:threonine/homoserine/homoserine lactone efflux protein
LKRNIKEGAKVAFAPILATFPILLVTLPFVSFFSRNGYLLGTLSVAGGIYLLYLAFETWKPADLASLYITNETEGSSPFWMGFNAALLSPHPYLFWSTAGAALLIGAWKVGITAAAVFLTSFLGIFFVSKMLLVFIAARLKTSVHSRGLDFLLRSLSLVLFGFGLALFFESLRLFGVVL